MENSPYRELCKWLIKVCFNYSYNSDLWEDLKPLKAQVLDLLLKAALFGVWVCAWARSCSSPWTHSHRSQQYNSQRAAKIETAERKQNVRKIQNLEIKAAGIVGTGETKNAWAAENQGTKVAEMSSLRAQAALEMPNVPVRPSVTGGESLKPREQ